jgi:hypothetical protein
MACALAGDDRTLAFQQEGNEYAAVEAHDIAGLGDLHSIGIDRPGRRLHSTGFSDLILLPERRSPPR